MLGDRDQLRQVLANLLGNALVHTPTGTPIEIEVRRNGRDAEMEVRDHGPGLPPGPPDELFERFRRAHGRREGNETPAEGATARGGAGLGLAIVAGIVAAHGGGVRAADADADAGGAAFVVTLPLAAGA